jgi:hypothetical protein
MPRSMRALVAGEVGEPNDVLRLESRPVPTPTGAGRAADAAAAGARAAAPSGAGSAASGGAGATVRPTGVQFARR